MKSKANLKANRNALEILNRQARGNTPALTCIVAPRPQPRRQSSLKPYKEELVKMREGGKTLEEVARWIRSVLGTQPHRSTVLRQLRARDAARPAIKASSTTKRHTMTFRGVEIHVIERHGLLDAKQEADVARKAAAIIRDLTRYVPKHLQDKRRHPFRSVGTRATMESALRCFGRFLQASRLGNLSAVPKGACQLYLGARAAIGIGRDQLKKDRRVLECAYREKLERVREKPRDARPDRAVSRVQLGAITAAQTQRNADSTDLAYAGGLRALELLTVAPIEEQPPSDRDWHPLLHAGLTGGKIYTCRGKGGLIRAFFAPNALAQILETKRRPEPILITDGKRRVMNWYDIAGGTAWASSFRKAALRTFGQSPGAHGVRHGYVLNRRRTLESLGLSKAEIEEVIAQELGHFRRDVVSEFYDHGPWNPSGGKRVSKRR